MASESLTLAIAFGAGILSCLSPCSLVLMPGFLSFVTGVHLGAASDRPDGSLQRGDRIPFSPRILTATLGFMAGFTTIFILLGAALGFVSQVVLSYQDWISRIAGIVIIFLGLVSLGLIRPRFLEMEYRLPLPKAGGMPFMSAFLIGGAFGIGWTPCTGATLTAILALAATSGSVQQGVLLLLAYCAGLLIPMAAAGLLSGWIAPLIERRRALMGYFNILTGSFLIFLGVIVFTNRFTQITGYLFFLGQ